MPKITLFNIQKLSTPTKLNTFLHHIRYTQSDIIALTEYDVSNDIHIQSTINSILSTNNFTPLDNVPTSRVQIFVSNSFHPTISSQNTFQQHFPPPYNQYVQDFNYTFEGIPTSFILVYVPTYQQESALTHLTTITQPDFLNTFRLIFSSHTPPSPCICGDWNSADNHSITDFLARHDCLDCLTKLPHHFTFKPTNISGVGTNRRLDRFYVHTSILNFHRFKYKLLKKLPFSTHLPVLLNIRGKSRRKQRRTSAEATFFSSHTYSARPSPFPHHILEDKALMDHIFNPTPLWPDNVSLSVSYYTEMIQARLQTIKKLIRTLDFNKPTRSSLRENLRRSHSSNPLSTTYKQLNERFKSKLKETTFSNSTIDKAYDLFSSLYTTDSSTDNSLISQIFNTTLSGFMDTSVTPSEHQQLLSPFTDDELKRNLNLLCAKGPSSPGPDGITYQAWRAAWHQACKHITAFANDSLTITGEIKPQHNIFNSIIKLIPKTGFDPEDPNPAKLRPISLTNTIFRLISYSLTKRCMPIFNRLISGHQQAFLEKRDIHLHIQTARILAHHLNTSPASINSILLIDVEKAFDKLNHEYIRIVLHKYGFPAAFIECIMYQTGTGSAQLLNGKFILKRKIPIQCGVRQGLPLSPLLFNLCLQPLILRLQAELKGIIFNPLHVATTSTLYPSLTTTTTVQAFADDLAVFARDANDLQRTFTICSDFTNISGLSLNKEKTKVYCHSRAIPYITSSISATFTVTSIKQNPKYLGIELLSVDWETKLSDLLERARRINFWDLPLHLRTLGMNTYIFSTLFFHDQHHPIPSQLLTNFVQDIKEVIMNQMKPSLPKKTDLWYIPRQLGGFGLLDLPTQLQGRRAYYILYTLFPSISKSQHPYLTQLFRLSLQAEAFDIENMTTINASLMSLIAEHNRDNKPEVHIPPNFTSHSTITLEPNIAITPWFSRIVNPDSSLPRNLHYSMGARHLKFNYSQLFRNDRREEEATRRQQLEASYLERNLLPPALGSYYAPLDLSLPTDQIVSVMLPPPPPPAYPNLAQYIISWQKVVNNITTNTSLSYRVIQLFSDNDPELLPLSSFALQKQFRTEELCTVTTSEDLNHLSKKLHWKTSNILITSRTWIDHGFSIHRWKKFYKSLTGMIYSNPKKYYFLYALNAGLLNNRFYTSCPCEHVEPTTQSPIRHVLNDCRITNSLWEFLHDDSPRPNLICPELNTPTMIQLNHFVGYLFYAHQMSYSRSINHEDPIDWSDEDELALLHHHYTSRYPDD